jgi:hypothetical protein
MNACQPPIPPLLAFADATRFLASLLRIGRYTTYNEEQAPVIVPDIDLELPVFVSQGVPELIYLRLRLRLRLRP